MPSLKSTNDFPDPENQGSEGFASRRVMKFAYASGSKPLDGYTIKRGIGIGGFGEVYFALSDAGKEVALKRIQRNLDVELRGVKQCINLKHINLISLWDIRTNHLGESWVVMEYVPGPSLQDIVDANPSGMPDDDVKHWFAATAAGVAYLHDQGIVHRDLKPANIFYDEDQQVIKIGDYGLSKFISTSRRSGQTETVGTFHYMAPEIGNGVYGKEIDIYALGIILYEILTGTVPFNGESSQEIMMKHLTADPDLSIVPEEFKHVIRKSLLKDPELRYSNIPEMCSDLPWPEIAENSQDIVKRNAVGRVVLNGVSDRPDLSQVKTPEPAPENTHSSRAKFPSLLAADQPDIVFGELKDASQPGQRVKKDSITIGNVTPRASTNANNNGRVKRTAPRDANLVSSMSTVPGEVRNEPVAQVVQKGWKDTIDWWTNTQISTPVKLAILATGTYSVAVNSRWLLPTAFGLAAIYMIYYIIRSLWLSSQSTDDTESKDKTHKEIRRQNEQVIRQWLGAREASDKWMELTASLLIAAFACMVFNLLALVLGGDFVASNIQRWATFAWLSVTSISASWALLVLGKGLEHRQGEPWFRRILSGTIGVGVGVLAFTMGQVFNINLAGMATSGYTPLPAFQIGPVLPVYIMLFGGLFVILRWWRQSDPIRRTRLSIAVVGICVVWTALLSQFFGINPLWNSILAVVISSAVQVASPWLHPQDQKRIHVEQINSAAVE